MEPFNTHPILTLTNWRPKLPSHVDKINTLAKLKSKWNVWCFYVCNISFPSSGILCMYVMLSSAYHGCPTFSSDNWPRILEQIHWWFGKKNKSWHTEIKFWRLLIVKCVLFTIMHGSTPTWRQGVLEQSCFFFLLVYYWKGCSPDWSKQAYLAYWKFDASQ